MSSFAFFNWIFTSSLGKFPPFPSPLLSSIKEAGMDEDNKMESERKRLRAYRLVAYAAVAFSAISVSSVVVTLPLVHNYVHYVRRSLDSDTLFCTVCGLFSSPKLFRIRPETFGVNSTI